MSEQNERVIVTGASSGIGLDGALARHQVRVSAVPPSIIRTPPIGAGADDLAAIHPLGRIGEVAETTDAVLFLVRSRFITGTVLDVDGGYARGR